MSRYKWTIALALPLVGGCAAGDGGNGSGGHGQGGVSWSTSSTGAGAAGQGGNGTAQGGGSAVGGGTAQGGHGGAGGGAGGNGSHGGAGGNGGSATGGELVFIAAGSPTIAGHFTLATGWQVTTMTNGSSSLAAISAGPTNSLAVTRQTSDKTLLYSVRNGSSWSQLSGISAGTTGLGITLAYQSTTGEHVLALRGTDTNHYVDAFLAGSWSLTEQVPAALGPSAAAMAPVGNNLVLAFAGNDTQLYTQARNNGSWAAAVALPGAHAQLSPALVVPTAGPELFLVWVNHQQNQMDDKKLFWATRTGGVWSPPAKISDNVFTDNAISAAALPNGDIIVAYRGTDTKAYSVYYSAGNNPPWAAAIPVAANSAIVGIPSVTAGINGALAELMYISASVTKVKHARLAAAGWYPAAAVPGPGAITAVAVMATP